jgi:excisionase family DNA binding protein
MLWTAREVAKHLRASISWVYKAAERGELPCIRLGAMLRFDPAAIRAWLGSRATAPSVTITRFPTEHGSE